MPKIIVDLGSHGDQVIEGNDVTWAKHEDGSLEIWNDEIKVALFRGDIWRRVRREEN